MSNGIEEKAIPLKLYLFIYLISKFFFYFVFLLYRRAFMKNKDKQKKICLKEGKYPFDKAH